MAKLRVGAGSITAFILLTQSVSVFTQLTSSPGFQCLSNYDRCHNKDRCVYMFELKEDGLDCPKVRKVVLDLKDVNADLALQKAMVAEKSAQIDVLQHQLDNVQLTLTQREAQIANLETMVEEIQNWKPNVDVLLNKLEELIVNRTENRISNLEMMIEEIGNMRLWSEWGSWTSCSVTCGGGIHSRSRTCDSCPSQSLDTESESCNDHCCPTAAWSPWNSWSPCSVVCEGSGTKHRSRTCTASCGGTCPGSDVDTTSCSVGPTCPVWSGWSIWTICPVTCGGETHSRTRTCQSCPAMTPETESQQCNEQCCPSGAWQTWTNWESCSTSCEGTGIQSRSRTCTSTCGGTCPGSNRETNVCSVGFTCPSWGTWTWNTCSRTCGGGTQTGTRSCNSCPGSDSTTSSCNTHDCPQDCTASWSSWEGGCRGSCTGLRTRYCIRPCGTGTCSGSSSKTISCWNCDGQIP